MAFKFKVLMFNVIMMLLGTLSLSAQQLVDAVSVYFRQGGYSYDAEFKENGKSLEELITIIRQKQMSGLIITDMEYVAVQNSDDASDGYAVTSKRRHEEIVKVLSQNLNYSTGRKPDYKRKDKGKMQTRMLAKGQQSYFVYIYEGIEKPMLDGFICITLDPKRVDRPAAKDWSRGLTVKTNIPGWALLMTNAALEIDIVKNLAFALPVHYAGWDYGKQTLKFRNLTIQPEIRYYIPKARGFYVGIHGGIAHCNFALDGDWRYQDHKGESPVYGGGLGLGWAFRFGKNTGWGMEIAVGAGAYHINYDVFYNEPNGPYYQRNKHKNYIGVDNASLSLTYRFDLRKSDKKDKEGSR